MNIKINAYIDVNDINEEAAIAAAIAKVESLDTVNEATIGRDVVTKLYYIVPLIGKIFVVVSESDRVALGVDNVVLANQLISEYPYIKLPPVISDYTELIVKKGSFLSDEQISNAAQAIVEESALKVMPNKIPILKIINYNTNEPSQLVMPAIFGTNTFLSTDAVVVNNGNVDAGKEVLTSPFGILDLNYGNSLEINKFQSGNVYAGDLFGLSVSVNSTGLIALVGASGSDVGAANGGAVYTFKRLSTDAEWVYSNTFVPAGIPANALFGRSVSLSGDGMSAIVGAPGENGSIGSVYTIVRDGMDKLWTVKDKYVDENMAEGSSFGKTVAATDNTNVVMVGYVDVANANNKKTSVKTLHRANMDKPWVVTTVTKVDDIPAYVYTTTLVDGESKEGNGLTDPSGSVSLVFDKIDTIDNFLPSNMMFASANGVVIKIDYSIEYSGNYFNVIVDGVGYRGIFENNEDFNNPIVLNILDVNPNAFFSSGVAISGNGLECLITSYGIDTSNVNSGVIHSYKRVNILDPWIHTGTITSDPETDTDHFGTGVALSGDGLVAMIGTYGDNTNGFNSGKVVTYKRSDVDSDWVRINSFEASVPAAEDYFGASIAISRYGHTTLVGAPTNDTLAEDAGIVFTFKQSLVV